MTGTIVEIVLFVLATAFTPPHTQKQWMQI